MALIDRININTVIDNLARELDKLIESESGLFDNYTGLVNTPDSKDKLRCYEALIVSQYNNIVDFASYWRKYCHTFNEAVSKERDIESIVMDDNKELREKYIEMVNRYNELLRYVVTTLRELKDSNKDMLNTLDEASSSIIYTRATKVKGINNPNTKRSIKTEELIQDYIAAGLVLTDEIVAKYNSITPVTYHGLRKRLVDAGVWNKRK